MLPTLVEGARLPDLKAFPPGLQPLFDTRNAREVTENGWEDDTQRLIADIAKATSLPVGPGLENPLSTAGAAQQRIAELEQARICCAARRPD